MPESRDAARLRFFAIRAAEAARVANEAGQAESQADEETLLNAGLTAAMLARIAAEQGADQDTVDALAPLLDDNPDETFLKVNTICIGGMNMGSCLMATVEIQIKAKCKSVG